MMATYSNVCDNRSNTNDSLDGVIQTDATKEDSAENMGSVQGSQVGWMIYSGDTEPLSVPMIPPASSWISPNRMLVYTSLKAGHQNVWFHHWARINRNHYHLTGHCRRHFLTRTVRQTRCPLPWSRRTIGIITKMKQRI